ILTHDISHRALNEERCKKLEKVVSDIQLFGNTEQINLVQNMVNEATQKDTFELDPLINELRNSLRKELGLREVDGNVKWLRHPEKTE
ncbi:MAG: hypothetical protein R6U11_01155, partial [Bacteroidales bacterium]